MYVDVDDVVQLLNSFLRATGKFSDMTATLPYIAGPCRLHPNLTKDMHIPLRSIPKEGTVREFL